MGLRNVKHVKLYQEALCVPVICLTAPKMLYVLAFES